MNPRLFGAPLALFGLAYVLSLATDALGKYTSQAIIGFGVVAAAVALFSASQGRSGQSLAGLLEALRTAARGKRPRVPEDATGEMAEAYDEVAKLAAHTSELTEDVARLEASGSGPDLGGFGDALQRAAHGERVRAPAGARGDIAKLYGDLGALADAVGRAAAEQKQHRADLVTADETMRKLAEGVDGVRSGCEQATGYIREITTALSHISSSI